MRTVDRHDHTQRMTSDQRLSPAKGARSTMALFVSLLVVMSGERPVAGFAPNDVRQHRCSPRSSTVSSPTINGIHSERLAFRSIDRTRRCLIGSHAAALHASSSSSGTESNDSNKIDKPDDTQSPADKAEVTLGTPPEQPTMMDYRKFALPCLGLWIAQPLLSLVDTAFVGLSSDPAISATQLAALGPATTFVDGATYLFAFLNVASTGLYSAAVAQHGAESDSSESTVRTAAKIGLRSGIGIMLFLLAFARPLLALYVGPEAAATPGLLDAATEYVKIRAFSMPTSLLMGVVQACLLGAKDSVTPLISIMYSTIVNVVGDFILVGQLGMGLRGAAIATALAQWVSTIALLGPARKRLVRDHNLRIWGGQKKTSGTVSGRSFLAYAAPVLTLILGKIAAFGFMTHSAAAVPGQPTPLAAHQIILSLFFFVSPFMEVISQTAQTFLPPFLARLQEYIENKKKADPKFDTKKDKAAQAWSKASMQVSTNLLELGVGVATVVASLACFIPAFGGAMLTSDGIVQGALKPLAKYLLVGGLLAAPVAVSEGILLARRELGFLATTYLATTALLPAALLRIKKVGGTVEQIWGCFAIFQLTRAIAFVGKIWSRRILGRFGAKSAGDTTENPPKEAS